MDSVNGPLRSLADSVNGPLTVLGQAEECRSLVSEAAPAGDLLTIMCRGSPAWQTRHLTDLCEAEVAEVAEEAGVSALPEAENVAEERPSGPGPSSMDSTDHSPACSTLLTQLTWGFSLSVGMWKGAGCLLRSY